MGLFDKLFGKKKKTDSESDSKQKEQPKVKVAVIYYSSTGTNYQLAKWAEEGAKQEGAEVKLVKVAELAPQTAIDSNSAWKAHLEETKDVPEASVDDLEWADAFIFSTPTRFGNLPSQMKQFLDTAGGLWGQGKLVNKVASGISSAGNPRGGQEKTVKHLYTTMMHWGAIIAAPGYTSPVAFSSGGNPYGTSVTVGDEGMQEDVQEAVKDQAKRTVTVTSMVKEGQEK
ncbi:NAD(P)H:quinone oxidoreductase [Salicibibacter halophilus]|uniref:NAD(P)H:quinone oxidoreductase n=1 Tax=Salicibibacter halophilus TaxID=2502791 RepID=A0A514LHL4_9BACI|nr:NAD(P)H:quinone oxidoreductase [Salicibibacter halophilus]QDI91348.1 NAD(P)H:quinone oxidoreductase [Salicibibacter halophilus]